jgi:hypothetical protein
MPELAFTVDDDGAQPIAIKISGTDKVDGPWEERFVCVNPFPAAAIVDFYAASGIDAQGNRVGSIARLNSLLQSVLQEEEIVEDGVGEDGKPRFRYEPVDDAVRYFALMRNKRRRVPYLTLLQIVNGLLEEVSGFPM